MTRENEILQYLHYNPGASRAEIEAGMNLKESPATVKRILAGLVEAGQAVVSGQGRATRYSVSAQAHVTMPLNIDTYFDRNAPCLHTKFTQSKISCVKMCKLTQTDPDI